MSIASRLGIAAVVVGLSTAGAAPDGINNNSVLHIGEDGIGNTKAASGPPPSCSNTLDFGDACNSQYLGMMRF